MTDNRTLNELIQRQIAFDERHGFLLKLPSSKEQYLQISKDLIGIIGEIGEFANLVKKINLRLDLGEELDCEKIRVYESQMKEELADVFIYLIRLAKLTNTDLESEYIAKQDKNTAKYEEFHA